MVVVVGMVDACVCVCVCACACACQVRLRVDISVFACTVVFTVHSRISDNNIGPWEARVSVLSQLLNRSEVHRAPSCLFVLCVCVCVPSFIGAFCSTVVCWTCVCAVCYEGERFFQCWYHVCVPLAMVVDRVF